MGFYKKGYMINYRDLKKNDEIKSTQLSQLISGKLLESPKQGKGLKKTILIWSKGSEIGMFDEAGSVYAREIAQVKRDGIWQAVTDAPC
tara:strand:+ start:159 stop:425 length:267 start_codon:yes stop_codon:yes gene_type:complete